MAENITSKAGYSEAKVNNARVRLDLITMDPKKLKTLKKLLKVRRKGYLWCVCGGKYADVTVKAEDTLTQDGSTIVYGSGSGQCTVYGTGPKTTDFVLTEIDLSGASNDIQKQITEALKAGQLVVDRKLSIVRYSSGSHGQPYFRTWDIYTDAYLEIETLHSASNATVFSGGEWKETEVYVYRGGEWVPAGTAVRSDGEWKE